MYKGWTTPEVVPIHLFFIADKKKIVLDKNIDDLCPRTFKMVKNKCIFY